MCMCACEYRYSCSPKVCFSPLRFSQPELAPVFANRKLRRGFLPLQKKVKSESTFSLCFPPAVVVAAHTPQGEGPRRAPSWDPHSMSQHQAPELWTGAVGIWALSPFILCIVSRCVLWHQKSLRARKGVTLRAILDISKHFDSDEQNRDIVCALSFVSGDAMFPCKFMVIASSLWAILSEETFIGPYFQRAGGTCPCVLVESLTVCCRMLISEEGYISQVQISHFNKQTPKWMIAQTQCKLFLTHGKFKRGIFGPQVALLQFTIQEAKLLPPGGSISILCLQDRDCSAKLAASSWWEAKSLQHRMLEMLMGQDKHHFCSHSIG